MTVPALPAIAKDVPRLKPLQAFKKQLTFLTHTTDWCTLGRGTGRKNRNRRGRWLPVSGKAGSSAQETFAV